MNPKIFINARFLSQEITGVQRFAIEICLHLKKINNNLIFLAPKKIIHVDLAVKLNAIQFGSFSGTLWEQISVPIYLRKTQGVLINLANTAPLFYSNNWLCLMDVSFFAKEQWFSRSFTLWYRFLIPRVYKRAKQVITISEFSKREITEYLGKHASDILIVGCGISTVFKYLNLNSEKKNYFLVIGSINPRKNLRRIIKAFLKIDAENLILKIVGQRNSNFADEKFESDERIEWCGSVDDEGLAKLYQNAICLVYPSLYEGFGIPPLEAMACGCPVIASREASLPEVCGNAALYCDAYDEQDITEKMIEISQNRNLSDQLIESGFDRVKLFSWEKSAMKMDQLLSQR